MVLNDRSLGSLQLTKPDTPQPDEFYVVTEPTCPRCNEVIIEGPVLYDNVAAERQLARHASLEELLAARLTILTA